jgi:DNA-binding response OmpR family regulator
MNSRLLIAHSEESLLDTCQSLFCDQGYEVAVAANVTKCLALLPVFLPDVLVLQRELRGISAELILSRLRSGRLLRQQPHVLLLTNRDVSYKDGDLIDPPVYAYLRTPVGPTTIVRAVRNSPTCHSSGEDLSLFPLAIHSEVARESPRQDCDAQFGMHRQQICDDRLAEAR